MFRRERLTRWTKEMIANPKQQFKGKLANHDLTKFCCLGKLCMVEGVRATPTENNISWKFEFGHSAEAHTHTLRGQLAIELGSDVGDFSDMGMVDLFYQGRIHVSLAEANDGGVPWPVIAAYLDEYYPCSDEVR